MEILSSDDEAAETPRSILFWEEDGEDGWEDYVHEETGRVWWCNEAERRWFWAEQPRTPEGLTL